MKHGRQDTRLIVYLLGGILIMLRVIADKITDAWYAASSKEDDSASAGVR